MTAYLKQVLAQALGGVFFGSLKPLALWTLGQANRAGREGLTVVEELHDVVVRFWKEVSISVLPGCRMEWFRQVACDVVDGTSCDEMLGRQCSGLLIRPTFCTISC